MSDTAVAYYERQLLGEIERIESEIRNLTKEKEALQRLLARARREDLGVPSTARKDSINRLAIERRVQDVLERAPKQTSTLKNLYSEARHINFDLKEGTFRTYIHRMKKKGTIESAGESRYRLPLKNSN